MRWGLKMREKPSKWRSKALKLRPSRLPFGF
nr:MAG TPA: hypothetical protein [Caudoviricetes sp.]